MLVGLNKLKYSLHILRLVGRPRSCNCIVYCIQRRNKIIWEWIRKIWSSPLHLSSVLWCILSIQHLIVHRMKHIIAFAHVNTFRCVHQMDLFIQITASLSVKKWEIRISRLNMTAIAMSWAVYTTKFQRKCLRLCWCLIVRRSSFYLPPDILNKYFWFSSL